MNLKLSAVTHNDQRLTSPITAFFDDAGGTVGRADHCTLALPDPERFISRKQAEVVAVTGGLFLIRNVGSANPIVIGQRSLGQNESAVLQDGDLVRIAGYELQVSYTTQGPGPRPTVLQRNQPAVAPGAQQLASQVAPPIVVEAPPAATAVAANPFGDLLAPAPQPAQAPASRADAWAQSPPAAAPTFGAPPAPLAPAANPFADLLAPGPHVAQAPVDLGAMPGPAGGNPFAGLLDSAPQRANGTAPLDIFSAPPPAPREPDLMPAAAGIPATAWQAPAAGAGTLPDDFDPFDLPPVKGLAPAAPMADPFGLVQSNKPQSIDRQFGLPTATEGRDPLADFMRPATVDLLPGDKRPEPVTDILGALAPPSAEMQSSISDKNRLAPIHDAFELPRPASAAPVRALPAPAAASATDVAGLWMAFCKGAGIQVAVPVDEAQLAQRLERLGRIVKAAVSGTQELMAVRASTKYEMRAQVTQIQARSNNPLKFAPDVRTGVEQLVEPAARGFLEGPAAMEDAMKDLIGHMIGSVAGMRAALEGALDNFRPEMLEKTLGQGTMLDSLVPMGRKARLWELYLLRYQTLRESAQDDFHTVFGKAFLAAYEQQVERLKKKEAQS